MPYIEFPKIVYLDGDPAKDSRRVEDADAEAAARREGFLALPAHPPADDLQPGGPQHLEFPKILYAGGQIDGETKRVTNAEEQAAAADGGFVPLGTSVGVAPTGDTFTVTAPSDAPQPRRGRKPKA